MGHRMLAVGVLVLLWACGKSATGTANDPYNMTGNWAGSDSGVDMTMALVDRPGGFVDGTGQLSSFGSGILLTVSGSRNGQGFMLTISHTGFQSAKYSGAVRNDSTLEGQLNESGFSGFPMVMHKN